MGIGKSTHPATDPRSIKTWLLKYLPVETAADECSNDVCSCSAYSCGDLIQGRVALKYYDQKGNYQPSSGFGIHSVLVNCRSDGGFLVKSVENMFDSLDNKQENATF